TSPAPPLLHPLSLHDALPISLPRSLFVFLPLAVLVLLLQNRTGYGRLLYALGDNPVASRLAGVKSWQVLIALYVLSAVLAGIARSEEHTSELQSRENLVCRLL